MAAETLYKTLKEKFSASVLHSLTLTLLDAKKNSVFRTLQSIHQQIFQNEIPGEPDGNKLFLELVHLVHPDRIGHIEKEIENAYRKKDHETLGFYHRILEASEKTLLPVKSPDRFEYSKAEDYSYDPGDFDHDFDRRDWDFEEDTVREEDSDFNFVRAVQAEYLGSLDVQFNAADLSSLSGEVDLSDYGILDLDGLEYCLNVTHLNLTHNRISNIHEIGELHNLKELYLGENMISDISPLCGLEELEILDISDNDIEDLTPLLKLTTLEFLRIGTNPVIENGVKEKLRNRGVIII